MRLQINFDDAVASLQEFLKENNHPTDVFWVFRDDLWRRSQTDVMLRYPSSARNLVLAQKVFSEGSEQGLVEIHAVAIAGDEVAATVWFPKLPNEQVQGWDCGMKVLSRNQCRALQSSRRYGGGSFGLTR